MTSSARFSKATLRTTLSNGRSPKESILLVAADLFFNRGYDVVSIDDIIRKVGGSKTSLYRYFGSKEGLLATLVEEQCAALVMTIDELHVDGFDVVGDLTKLGNAYLAIITSPRAVALHRLLIAQASRFPHLSEAFLRAGPQGATNKVATIFARWQQNGSLGTKRSADRLAEQYLNLLKSNVQARLLLAAAAAPKDIESNEIVSEAIETFILGAGFSKASGTKVVTGRRQTVAHQVRDFEPAAIRDFTQTSPIRSSQNVNDPLASIRSANILASSAASAAGLSESQFSVMAAVLEASRRSEGAPISEVASITKTAKSNISQMLDRLEKLGLVVRTSDPADRRRKHVKLTNKGEQKISLAMSKLAP